MRGEMESNEVVANAVEYNRLKAQLATNEMSTFPLTMRLLGHPNIFIADSACSAQRRKKDLVDKGSGLMLANGSIHSLR
jgi:hypothetical protein